MPRLSRIHYSGKYFDYPLKAQNALSGLGLVERVSHRAQLPAVASPAVPGRRELRAVGDEPIRQAALSRSSSRRTPKKCGAFRAPRSAPSGRRSAFRACRWPGRSSTPRRSAARDPTDQDADQRVPVSAPRARADVGDRCRDGSQEMGGAGADAARRHRDRDARTARVVAVRAQTPDGERRFEAEHVISTMPMRDARARAATPRCRTGAQRAGEGLNYRDFLVVALILDSDDLFPDNWIYIHTPGVKVGRIQNFNNWSRAMVPEPGTTCLGMEYFCFEGDGLWKSRRRRSRSRWRRGSSESSASATRRKVVDGTRRADAEGVSRSTTRTYRGTSRRRSARASIRFRTCTRSAATACTSTTTRITRCSRR